MFFSVVDKLRTLHIREGEVMKVRPPSTGTRTLLEGMTGYYNSSTRSDVGRLQHRRRSPFWTSLSRIPPL